jgi:hypothetical protein
VGHGRTVNEPKDGVEIVARESHFMKKIQQPGVNYMKKYTLGLMGLCLISAPVLAADVQKDSKDSGKVDLSIKAMTILDAEDNGYDPNDGTAYLLKLKYETASWNKIKLGVGMYTNGDLFNLTDFDTERVARGMFVTDDGSEKSQLGELYLDYKPGDSHLYGGRMIYKTPLTTIKYSTMPNFYNVYGASTKIFSKAKIGIAQITDMSFGARSMTDFGLIGEGTKSAGAAIKTSTIGQAEFHDIYTATTGKTDQSTNGITVLNAEYKPTKNLKLALWDYYVDDIANNIYFEVDGSIPLTGKKIKLSGQYLTQSDTGSKLAGELDFNMAGLKASIGNKKWGAFVAYNTSSGDTAMLNAWGGDPAYTSTIFSRNAYRENVDAYKVGGRYKIVKNLTVKVGYANYGQSDTLAPAKVIKVAPTGMVAAMTDAEELDIVLIWKAQKNLTLKLFHANRTSEYDGTNGKDLTQAHTRLIGVYKF